MKKIIAILTLLIMPVSAFAYVDGGISAITGSDDYVSYRIFADIGTENGLSFMPAIGTFNDKYTSGTDVDYSLGLGMIKTYSVFVERVVIFLKLKMVMKKKVPLLMLLFL